MTRIPMVALCVLLLPSTGRAQEKVAAKDAWLYHSATYQLPRTVSKEKFDQIRQGMTLGELQTLLGKAWMRPQSSIRDIHWGCRDGRTLTVWPGKFSKEEVCQINMYREKNGEIVEALKVPAAGTAAGNLGGKPSKKTGDEPGGKIGDKTGEELGDDGFVDSDGVKLHYVTAGKGPLIVLLHGFPDFWYTWRDQMPALAKHGRVVALDLRGY